jgi:hypothetical protein
MATTVGSVCGFFGAEDLRLDLVEVGPPTLKMKLNPPAAKPEVVGVQTGDFPYLPPIPGSKAGNGSHDDSPMMLDVDVDKNTHEKQVVGSGSIIKSYTLPPPLRTTILFVTVYREALTQAGWTIVHQVQSIQGSDAVLNAHTIPTDAISGQLRTPAAQTTQSKPKTLASRTLARNWIEIAVWRCTASISTSTKRHCDRIQRWFWRRYWRCSKRGRN